MWVGAWVGGGGGTCAPAPAYLCNQLFASTFTWFLGIELMLPVLQSTSFTFQAISPAPSNDFVSSCILEVDETELAVCFCVS